MNRFLIATTLIILLLSCGNNSYSPNKRHVDNIDYGYEASPEIATSLAKKVSNDEIAPISQSNASSDTHKEHRDTKIIYTANARMQVDSLEKSIAKIVKLISYNGGFISNQRVEDNTYSKSATLTLRLPVKAFTNQVDGLLSLGKFVDYQEINSQDVSAEWVDLESRLKTKRMVRDRYIEILRKKAKKVEDILNAEEKIRAITEEIEAKEGQLRYLSDQVSMSTFTLEIYQTQSVTSAPPRYVHNFGSEIIDSLSNGLFFIKDIFLAILSIWPLLLIAPFVRWGWKKWKSSRK